MTVTHTTTAELALALRRYDSEAKLASLLTPRYRLDYADWGNPTHPTIVLVHGMADQKRSFAMLMMHLVDAGFRCIAYELADGYHDGAKLRNYQHADFVEDLLALLDHLQLRQTHILGCSFGSTITLLALAKHPERFACAVLQGGFARRPLNNIEAGLAKLAQWLPGRMGQLPGRKNMMAKVDLPQLVGCPPEVFDFLIECGGRTPNRAAGHRALILGQNDLRPLLPTIPHPLLMLGGDRDTVVPPEFEAEVQTGLPNATRTELPETGHYPQYSCPTTIAKLMAEFLIT
jgi:pimeloyl-ACP methyl ester carboxylesterase